MNDGKQLKSWLNRVLSKVGALGLQREDQAERWSPACGAGQQLELGLEVQVRPVRKTARRASPLTAATPVKTRVAEGIVSTGAPDGRTGLAAEPQPL